ncbi:class I SAM-dependent methyltransferase [Chitinophaga qingshengii]|uniref:Class I SAM-dependent methyltransferase n=1 Tax=Chitinophaga qingshengii TaxID=1569794 RepID=A0ABR7TTZ0_9BACT|nr:class I SAM-dependent methyltransferase [Chitinophaga qingshengii]MBC9933483.1 class I SAM-dependent methyltransferase [Chitinophaga qingshengii]
MISTLIRQSIDCQYRQHARHNFFYPGNDIAWTNVTRRLATDGLPEVLALRDADKAAAVVDYLTAGARRTFCNVNQYLDMSAASTAALREIYTALVTDVVNAAESGHMQESRLTARHTRRLQGWLRRTNPFFETLYADAGPQLKPVVCAEYEAALQLNVLRLDLAMLQQPVLDLGCGSQATLVRWLRQRGIAAYGVDRFIASPEPYLKTGDWLDISLPPGYWGTIISNLSFSNHFLHHHYRDSPDCTRYAAKYREILQALRPGGSYHYAPALPMVETYLSPEEFQLQRMPVTGQFTGSIVTRLPAGA